MVACWCTAPPRCRICCVSSSPLGLASGQTGCGWSLLPSVVASAARPGCTPNSWWWRRWPCDWGRRWCGWPRAAKTCSAWRTAEPRCSTPSSAAGATARSRACGCAWWAMAVRTRVSAPSCQRAHGGCRTAPTGWVLCTSTSSWRPPTPHPPVPIAAPDGRRRRRCWSASSTSLRSSWVSTRWRSGAATSSPTMRSRSPRSPASPTTAVRTPHRSTRRCAWWVTTTCGANSRPAASAATGICSVSAWPCTWRSLPVVRAASTARSLCTPTGRPRCWPAPRRTVRATRPRSR